MCSTGSPEALRIRSIRSRRSQPDCVAGWVEMMISSGRRSAIASIVARNGSESPTSPVASMPSLGEQRQREVDAHLRGFAHGLVVDHETGRGLALRHDERGSAASPAARARAHRVEQLCARRACGWRRPGFPSSVLLLPQSLAGSATLPAGVGARSRGRGRRREDAVHGARHAVLVGSADDRRDAIEVEDRRRRGDLPLERQRAPRVGHRARAAAPAGDHVVDEDQRAEPEPEARDRDEQVQVGELARRSRRRAAACPAGRGCASGRRSG